MKKIVLILVAVVVVAVVGVVVYANTMAARGVERGSEYALGVETSVARVNLGVLSGNFGISSFTVQNPEGFESDHFFAMRSTDMSVGLRSILADTVVVERLALDGIELNIEMRNRDSNCGAILENLRRFEKNGGGTEASKDGGKRLVIDELVITDVVARVSAKSPELGIDTETTVEVPVIRLEGVGRKSGGVEISELASIVLTRVIDAVMRSGGDLPSQLRSTIQSELGYLLDQQESLVANAEASGKEAVKEATKGIVDDAKKQVSDLFD